jgi:hypothetical protein
MILKNIKISQEMTKSQMSHYYLFIDEQLLCAWWDYLDYWNEFDSDALVKNPIAKEKMEEIMMAVEYWEGILDQLKEKITFQDIEDYLTLNPHIKKNFLFIRT